MLLLLDDDDVHVYHMRNNLKCSGNEKPINTGGNTACMYTNTPCMYTNHTNSVVSLPSVMIFYIQLITTAEQPLLKFAQHSSWPPLLTTVQLLLFPHHGFLIMVLAVVLAVVLVVGARVVPVAIHSSGVMVLT